MQQQDVAELLSASVSIADGVLEIQSAAAVAMASLCCKQRQSRRARCRPRSDSAGSYYLAAVRLLFSLLAVALALSQVDAADSTASVDVDNLTWTQWRALYAASATSMTLERVYRTSPRVRAKLLVAKQISMSQLLAGEAILRQQLSDVAGVDMVRVQLESLQTNALKEGDRGEYFASFGVSAIPDPMSLASGSQDLSDSVTLAAAIDQERERIIQRLRYGAIVRGQNVTIPSLTLFGSQMKLVDVSLDGESFYPIDLKPWIAARIAVVPAAYISSSSVSGASSSGSTTTSAASQTGTSLYYEPSRDAFQNLRLRFLLTKALLPLRLTPSDILLRGTRAPVAFSAYHSGSASVVDVEVHVNDESFRVAVDGYLRNSSLAQAFSAAEPQWSIAAIDVDLASGLLYSLPSTSSTGSGSTTAAVASHNTLEMAFELNDVPFMQVASRKWHILERFAQWLSLNGCYSCQVRFKSVGFVSAAAMMDSNSASHNDGDSVDETVTALDPINTKSTTLSFHVDTLSSTDSTVLFENLQRQVASDPEAALCGSIGVDESVATAGAIPATCALTSYRNTSSTSTSTVSPEPFVLLNLTLELTDQALNASITTAQVADSVFDQFRVRCALLVLFQQVVIYDEHVKLQATSLNPTEASLESSEPLLLLSYKVVIADESQRKGIKALFLSKRFQRTIGEYTQQRLKVVDRVADLHADGSPSWLDAKLPGITLSLENEVQLGRLGSSPSATNSSGTRVYRYQDPLEGLNPSVLTFPVVSSAPTCSYATTDASPSVECIAIRFTSEFDSEAPLFVLRQIESNVEISSPSLVLPPAASESEASTAIASSIANLYVAAPRIASNQSTAVSASYPWILYADTSSLPQSLVASSSNSTVVVVLLRFHLEFSATGLSGSAESSKRALISGFRLDVRVEIDSKGGNSSSRRVSVHKSSFLPVVTVSVDADGHSENAVTAFGHLYLDPFVSAHIQVNTSATSTTPATETTTSSGGHSAVAIRIYQSSLGAFFDRAQVASSAQASSSSPCSACYAKLDACNASLECRALSACFGAATNSDPALYASLLLQASAGENSSNSTSPARHDLSPLLQQCLSGQSGSAGNDKWTLSTLTLFLDGVLCTSSSQCPIETTSNSSSLNSVPTLFADGPSRALVVRYTPMEQTLTFPDSDFTATLQFLIDTDDGVERSQAFTDLTRDDASLSALQAMLMELYSGQSSTTISFPFVQVSRSADEVVHIRYFFLSTWTSSFTSNSNSSLLPYVQSISGDSPVVTTTVTTERLELVVQVDL